MNPAKLSLPVALQHSSVAIAVFDTDFRCSAANFALSGMTGLLVETSTGRTLGEIFNGQGHLVERSFRMVRHTARAVRNVQLNAQNGRKPWIGDFFPLRNTSESLRWIGMAFCELPAKSGLQQDLLNSNKCTAVADSRTLAFVATEELCASVLRKTFGLLDRSMCLRRRLTERRLTAYLREDAWAPIVDLRTPVLTRELPAADTSATDSFEPGAILHPLSARETEVICLLAEGKSNKQIATALCLSTRTVETYRARVMTKLDLHSLADLIRYAIRNRIIAA